MRLYHYLSSQGLGLLKNGYIPLECWPHNANPIIANINVANEGISGVSNEDYEAYLQKQYKMIPAHLSGVVSFEFFIEQNLPNKEKICAQIKQRQVVEGAYFPVEKLKKAAYLRLFADVTLFDIWQQTENFKGIALGLNVNQFQKLNFGKLQRVKYSEDKRVKVEPNNPFPGLLDMPPYLQHQQEWRWLQLSKSAILKKGHPQFKIQPKQIESIICGPNCSDEIKNSLSKLVKVDKNFKGVQLQQACVDPFQFKFSLAQIS